MAVSIAELVVTVGADISRAQRGLQAVENRLQGMSRGVLSTAASFAPLSAALGAVGVVGLKAFADYDEKIAELVARTGVMGDELAQVEALAQRFGTTTRYSATQAVDAMLQLISSGQTLEEAMSTVDDVLTMASVSGLDLGTSADALTDIMAQFGLETGEAAGVVNILSNAAGASSATVSDLVDAMANVGPVARAYGVDVGTAAATLAVLSENGVKGAEAGTALKSMLLNMTRPTEEVTAAWEALGTSFYDAQGNARPLPVILEDIKAGLADKTPEEANEILKDLAGSYGIVALNALLGGQSIQDMLDTMEMQTPATELAAVRNDTLAGKLDRLRSSIQVLLIQAMKPFVESYLNPLLGILANIIGHVTNWIAQNPQLTSTVVAVGAALVGFTATLTVLGGVLGVVGAAVGALASPLVLVAGLVIGLGIAWKTNFLGIRDAIQNVLDKLQNLYNDLDSAFEEGSWQGLGKRLGELILQGIGDLAGTFYNDVLVPLPGKITEIAPEVTTQATALAQGVWDAYIGLLTGLGQAMWDEVLIPLGARILEALPDLSDKATQIGTGILDALLGALASLPNAVIDLLNSAIPNEIDLGSFEKTFDLGPLGKQTAKVEFGTLDLPDNPIPRFASGGIVTKPTLALVGEAGPEAIIPLTRHNSGQRQLVVNGPVIIQGVQRPEELWRELERVAQRRNIQFGRAAL